MNSYQGQVDGILSLGPNIWCGEYKFPDHDQAAAVYQIVAAAVPEIVTLSQSQQANMVVGEFDDGSRLFVGGLMSNDAFVIAHTFITSGGGQFLHGAMPGGKAMLSETSVEELRALGVEPEPAAADPVESRAHRPSGFDQMVAEIERGERPHKPELRPAKAVPKPWWKIWA